MGSSDRRLSRRESLWSSSKGCRESYEQR
jgi:hypothetical protein